MFVGAVARGAVGDYAGGEAQGEADSRFDLTEARVAFRTVDHCGHLDGLFAEQRTRCVEAVEADVRKRAAACERLALAPLGRISLVLRVDGVDELELAEFTASRPLAKLHVVRLILAALSHHQQA